MKTHEWILWGGDPEERQALIEQSQVPDVVLEQVFESHMVVSGHDYDPPIVDLPESGNIVVVGEGGFWFRVDGVWYDICTERGLFDFYGNGAPGFAVTPGDMSDYEAVAAQAADEE